MGSDIIGAILLVTLGSISLTFVIGYFININKFLNTDYLGILFKCRRCKNQLFISINMLS